ncbi:uncharacterized protein BO96DRAFT_467791 [Aspergillus niger CBS 101883]|uniref:uncharacterized protein n=1 Tax=Aspergillus lacticoffeatus (strain CBS 101883) TaxID=1450533 RepID=UPI000D7F2870|nr:uncharacterized protein BO96DRAFT_467791 [Aspergillus niger CBS 101883]PYH54555.1 hypothetical protein BO96DRAFT_467791 [Aspergillus niger CBS 101883]
MVASDARSISDCNMTASYYLNRTTSSLRPNRAISNLSALFPNLHQIALRAECTLHPLQCMIQDDAVVTVRSATGLNELNISTNEQQIAKQPAFYQITKAAIHGLLASAHCVSQAHVTRGKIVREAAKCSLAMSQGKKGSAADSGDPPDGSTWHGWGKMGSRPIGIMASLAGAVTGRQTGLIFDFSRFDKFNGRQAGVLPGSPEASVWPPALTKNAEGKGGKVENLEMGNLESATASLHKLNLILMLPPGPVPDQHAAAASCAIESLFVPERCMVRPVEPRGPAGARCRSRILRAANSATPLLVVVAAAAAAAEI